MNIAITSYSLPPFDSIGAGVQNHYLANAFVRSGHRVTMFSPHLNAPDDALYHHVSVEVSGRLKTLKWSTELSKIDFSSFDYLHCTGDDHFIKTQKKTCHLRQYHGNSLSEYRHARTNGAKLRSLFLFSTEICTGFRADILTCVSSRAAKPLPKRTHVIPCGVDLSTFTPGCRKTDFPSILFVGTLESRKRGDLLVREFISKVKVNVPNTVLNIVRETKLLGLSDVNVHGFIERERLISLYQSSWIFCLPSTYEGFGVPYVEAMSCGTAVVATPNEGSLEVLDNGKYGLLCSQNDLGNELISLLSDGEKIRSLELAGLERSRNYDWTNVVLKYLQLVQQYHE